MSQEDVLDYIRKLPKAELHLHLEGTILPTTLVELSQRHDARPLTLAEASALYRYEDFTGFLMAFKAVTQRLCTPEDYERITYLMLKELARQGVVHAEVYVSIGVIYYWRKAELETDPLLIEHIFEAMERGREQGERDFGTTLYWIFDAVRHFGVEEAQQVFEKAAELKSRYPSIIGIGIGGDERRTGPEPFRELYFAARDAGLRLTAHAGETVGPESLWGALNIGAERLGHALTAGLDAELLDLLAERQIPVELCMTSNVKTGCCARLDRHPVRWFFDHGLMVTLNSDDPAMFGSNLEEEYLLAHEFFRFTKDELRELASNSIEASFLPPEKKVAWLREIESIQ